jgi:hypothetical protein
LAGVVAVRRQQERGVGSAGWGGRHHFAPDDEDAFEYENYHNPDHTY